MIKKVKNKIYEFNYINNKKYKNPIILRGKKKKPTRLFNKKVIQELIQFLGITLLGTKG